jgi:hypothetical protein
MANTKIEANPSAVYKTVILLRASPSPLLHFLNCCAFIKERRVNPPLFKDQDERGRCLVLENSPPIFTVLPLREKRKCSFFSKTILEKRETSGSAHSALQVLGRGYSRGSSNRLLRIS